MRKTIYSLLVAPLLVAGTLAAGAANAQPLCDFITGGGGVMGDFGARVNFGAHGGCKHGAFWGHVNLLDKGFGPPPGHLNSTRITAYFPSGVNARSICGEGEVIKDSAGNRFKAKFHAKMEDNAEPGIQADRFGIRITEADTGRQRYHLSMRPLRSGAIELHKENPSTTGPDQVPDCDVAPPNEFPEPVSVGLPLP